MVRRMGRGRWAMFRDDEAGLRGEHERRDGRSRISSTTLMLSLLDSRCGRRELRHGTAGTRNLICESWARLGDCRWTPQSH